MRSTRQKGAILALVVVSMALTLACGLGGAAVRAGSVVPPDVDADMGSVRLIARLTIIPHCSQLISADCVQDEPVPRERIYTVWLFSRTRPGSWENPEVRQLVAVALGPGR